MVIGAFRTAREARRTVAFQPTTTHLASSSISAVMTPAAMGAYCTLAVLQGLLVALPRPGHAPIWDRLRSPGWALVLPGSLLVGTFGVLAFPGFAAALAVLALVTTPVLAWLAVTGVARGPRRVWLIALLALTVAVGALSSWPEALATSIVTGLGCLALGAALVRLTPMRWLAAGIAAMCVLDVALLATGIGQPAAVLLNHALSDSHLPDFHRAQLGSITKDYPDLVLTAVLGNTLAGSRRQRTAALLVTLLASANGLLFLVADMLPATVPIGVAGAVVIALERRGSRRKLHLPRYAKESPPGRRQGRALRRPLVPWLPM